MCTTPVDGGPEEMIPEMSTVMRTRAWTVRPDGIYFFQRPAGEPLVQTFHFATRKITTLLAPPRSSLATAPGLDVSPDGRTLLFTQVDQRVDGLMMVENFR